MADPRPMLSVGDAGMATFAGPEYFRMLHEASRQLVESYTTNTRISADRVLAAVTRARGHVRTGYAALLLTAPPADEYVSLVIGLARQELDSVHGPIVRQGRVIGAD